jgi:hypothetical protein
MKVSSGTNRQNGLLSSSEHREKALISFDRVLFRPIPLYLEEDLKSSGGNLRGGSSPAPGSSEIKGYWRLVSNRPVGKGGLATSYDHHRA